jgi:hypothetical protein
MNIVKIEINSSGLYEYQNLENDNRTIHYTRTPTPSESMKKRGIFPIA